MEKRWQPQKNEAQIYQFWEKNKYFTPKIDPTKKPFTILLPPPNANDPLHLGHAMYVIEDILCRWHRMKGEPTLFLPGTDHAGVETQYVFEQKLQKEGKSRFDFDRQTLYRMIHDYVEKYRGVATRQMRQLGFSLDWSREKYTLDPDLLKTVFTTFRKLHRDGLVYRANRIVNYCPHCGTSFSDLEVNYVERDDFLYYLDYGPIQIATTRPETIFADVAVAVNPKDRRYRKLVGQKAVVPLIDKEVPIISDALVDPQFGTGALKITPAHDTTDFEIGQRHHLPAPSVISTEGKLVNVPQKYQGLTVKEARRVVVADLEKAGKLVKKEPLHHTVGTCYRCGTTIEPLLLPQWFVKIQPLAKPAIAAVKKGRTKIIPRRFEKLYFNWMENIRDWNISRQTVWGPRIPAWYCLDCNPDTHLEFIDQNGQRVKGKYRDLKKKYSFAEMKAGLQNLTAPTNARYFTKPVKKCPVCGGQHILQETDTFDTWFSSGQWPLTTLGYPDSPDFKYFYPTSVLDTMWDILFFWVARMIMFGLYLAGDVPFRVAHMHARVVDAQGRKMSKSKGNVLNPIDLVEKYGADALRMALVYGVAPASDIALSEKKVEAMRNFANKVWNAARFVLLTKREFPNSLPAQAGKFQIPKRTKKEDQKILAELKNTVETVNQQLEKYRFGQALEIIYQFFWHQFCDQYLEAVKNRRQEALPVLFQVLLTSLKLLHPFAPFVSEAIYQEFRRQLPHHPLLQAEALAIAPWPES